MPRARTFTLADGARVLVRPIEPADRRLLEEVLDGLSDESLYRRFLAHRSALSDLELDYLTDVDHRNHEALLAIDVATQAAVGVARYVRVAPRTAELAVTVVDDWQARGVGGYMLRLLAKRARPAGIRASSPSRSPATSPRCACSNASRTRRAAPATRMWSSAPASGAGAACAGGPVRRSARCRRSRPGPRRPG